MIRTASGGLFTSQTWFLVSGGPCDNAGIRHGVGSVKAGSHGRPFSPTPNAQKLAQRHAADGGFAPTRYFWLLSCNRGRNTC